MPRSVPFGLRIIPLAGLVAVPIACSTSTVLPTPTPARPAAEAGNVAPDALLEALAIPVSAVENRPVSFTNKRAAYFYTQTHRNDHPEHAWFRGLNIAGRRIFNDYHVVVRGAELDPAGAQVVVRPDALVRTYPGGITETLRLVDGNDVVEVEVTGAVAVELRLTGDQLKPDGAENGVARYVSTTPGEPPVVDHLVVGRRGARFLIAVAPTRPGADSLLAEAADSASAWDVQRRRRLAGLIGGERYLRTDDPRLTESLRWITLTTDELVTRQRGDGIYAGLPWFNEYWGRDSFIALAGATLVTGHFEEARAILTSFARFQQLNRASPFYGRMPNIVKPGSIDYHTVDGTPRWVIALRDYLRYTGDISILTEMYPHVVASIEGALEHWVDRDGYLLHQDNETWMDARREPDKAAYATRGTRANDIQALWYEQLQIGASLARGRGDTARATRWTAAAERLRQSFNRDFVDATGARIADRLDGRNAPDFTLRPNLLFALDLVNDDTVAARALRRAWQALVYPWGVATLDQDNPFFHPYHIAWEHYHKDEAYHNGTIWPWLNGIALERMIERGQLEPAWRLFRWTSELALRRGVVGGLPENMDAYPHPGDTVPRLTGTFLQAWSNAEHLRVWYQEILGIRPDLMGGAGDAVGAGPAGGGSAAAAGAGTGRIVLAPRLPAELGDVEFSVRVGGGTLHGHYTRLPDGRRYVYTLNGAGDTLRLDILSFEATSFAAAPGDSLVAEVRGDGLRAWLVPARAGTARAVSLTPSAPRAERQAKLDALFAGVRFAAPRDAESHPVMRQVYRR